MGVGILRARGAQAVPIPCDAEGMLPDELERAIVEQDVRLVYLIPTYHNPEEVNRSAEQTMEMQAASCPDAHAEEPADVPATV